MNLTRRQKFVNSGRTITKIKNRVNINFDLVTLDLMCSYVMSNNRNIRTSHLINLRNLIEVLDMSLYSADEEKLKRIAFIKKALEARVLRNIHEPKLILKYTNGGILDDDSNVISLADFGLLSNAELDYVNQTVSDGLKYGFIYNNVDDGIDILTRFKAADYRSRVEIVNEIEEWVNRMQTSFRRAKSESVTDMMFSLKEGKFEETLRDVYDIITSPNRKLVTGMQGINEMTAGGFEGTRVYGLMGATGVGKSLCLLNLAVQIKKHNPHYIPKDPTKIPTIVYLTMENTVVETVTRLFNIATTATDDMKNYSLDDIVRLLKTEGELLLSEDSPINILIKYMPNKSVDTGYLYTLVEDLEDEGYETICLIQDHMKRIRSCYPQTDIRIELGEIVNEFKVFAQLKDIPVITNTHLNREASKVIDEMRRSGKQDLTRQLGRANVGESMLILDNIDCAFIINVEYDVSGHKYMIFNRVKMRDRASDRDYICQPFVAGNDIKFVEDYGLEVPAFRESLKEQPTAGNLYGGTLNNQTPLRSARRNQIQEVTEISNIFQMKKEENIFSGSIYNKTSVSVHDYDEEEDIDLIQGLVFPDEIGA